MSHEPAGTFNIALGNSRPSKSVRRGLEATMIHYTLSVLSQIWTFVTLARKSNHPGLLFSSDPFSPSPSFSFSHSSPRSLPQPLLPGWRTKRGGPLTEMTFTVFSPLIRPNARRRYNGKTKYEMMKIAVWWLLELSHEILNEKKIQAFYQLSGWLTEITTESKLTMLRKPFASREQTVFQINYCSFQGLI